MRYWKDERTGLNCCEPDCADEWMELIWQLGSDYDGCDGADDLKHLIDHLVNYSQNARQCLKEGRVFTDSTQN